MDTPKPTPGFIPQMGLTVSQKFHVLSIMQKAEQASTEQLRELLEASLKELYMTQNVSRLLTCRVMDLQNGPLPQMGVSFEKDFLQRHHDAC